MTERLKELLHEESDQLDIPASPAGAILARGRRQRRRRTAGLTVAGVVAATGIAAGALVLGGLSGDGDTAPDPAAPVGGNAVFALNAGDATVHYDGPGRTAAVDDKAVKSLYYTSAGVLVRHGNNTFSDGGGPQRFSLIAPDGTVSRLGLVTEETVHDSDAGQPYVAYAENVGGTVEAVVYDVVADAEVARVAVADTQESWFPVSLDGDTLYVQAGYGGGIFAVDWRAGTAGKAEGVESAWDVVGGLQPGRVGKKAAVVEVASGDVVLTAGGQGYFELSPDGEHAMLVEEMDFGREPAAPETVLYDLASGSRVTTLPGDAFNWGWTADGDVFRVGKGKVTTCSADTGECSEESYEPPSGRTDVRIGGNVYES